jgi:hypothetical protein
MYPLGVLVLEQAMYCYADHTGAHRLGLQMKGTEAGFQGLCIVILPLDQRLSCDIIFARGLGWRKFLMI